MKAANLEPCLLPTFRGFIILELAITLLGASLTEHGEPVHSAEMVVLIGGLSVGLLVYLCWPRLQHRLGSAYLPLAVIVAAALPLIEQHLSLLSHPLPNMASQHANEWQVVLSMFFPLLIVSWQYSIRSAIGFCAVTGLLDLASVASTQVQLDAVALEGYLRSLVMRTAFFLLAGSVICLLMRQQRKQRRELEQANRQLQQHAATLEQLTISRERNRLARELHDTLAHTLSGLAVQLEAMKAVWDVDANRAQAMLDRSLNDTRTGLTETRRAIQALRANPLDELGLPLALRQLAEAAADRGGLTLDLQVPIEVRRLRPDVEQCVYRVAQEALENAVKHSEARRVCLQITSDDGQLIMSLADDGKGFVFGDIDEHCQFGLRGLQERARLIGGQLAVDTRPGQGTTVRLTLEQTDD